MSTVYLPRDPRSGAYLPCDTTQSEKVSGSIIKDNNGKLEKVGPIAYLSIGGKTGGDYGGGCAPVHYEEYYWSEAEKRERAAPQMKKINEKGEIVPLYKQIDAYLDANISKLKDEKRALKVKRKEQSARRKKVLPPINYDKSSPSLDLSKRPNPFSNVYSYLQRQNDSPKIHTSSTCSLNRGSKNEDEESSYKEEERDSDRNRNKVKNNSNEDPLSFVDNNSHQPELAQSKEMSFRREMNTIMDAQGDKKIKQPKKYQQQHKKRVQKQDCSTSLNKNKINGFLSRLSFGTTSRYQDIIDEIDLEKRKNSGNHIHPATQSNTQALLDNSSTSNKFKSKQTIHNLHTVKVLGKEYVYDERKLHEDEKEEGLNKFPFETITQEIVFSSSQNYKPLDQNDYHDTTRRLSNPSEKLEFPANLRFSSDDLDISKKQQQQDSARPTYVLSNQTLLTNSDGRYVQNHQNDGLHKINQKKYLYYHNCAAILIQSRYRGFICRKHLWAPKGILRSWIVTKITKIVRGYLARKRVCRLYEQKRIDAATTLCAAARGMKGRRIARGKRVMIYAVMAERIQNMWRGELARRWLRMIRKAKELEKINMIQRQWRRYRAKTRAIEKRTEIEGVRKYLHDMQKAYTQGGLESILHYCYYFQSGHNDAGDAKYNSVNSSFLIPDHKSDSFLDNFHYMNIYKATMKALTSKVKNLNTQPINDEDRVFATPLSPRNEENGRIININLYEKNSGTSHSKSAVDIHMNKKWKCKKLRKRKRISQDQDSIESVGNVNAPFHKDSTEIITSHFDSIDTSINYKKGSANLDNNDLAKETEDTDREENIAVNDHIEYGKGDSKSYEKVRNNFVYELVDEDGQVVVLNENEVKEIYSSNESSIQSYENEDEVYLYYDEDGKLCLKNNGTELENESSDGFSDENNATDNYPESIGSIHNDNNSNSKDIDNDINDEKIRDDNTIDKKELGGRDDDDDDMIAAPGGNSFGDKEHQSMDEISYKTSLPTLASSKSITRDEDQSKYNEDDKIEEEDDNNASLFRPDLTMFLIVAGFLLTQQQNYEQAYVVACDATRFFPYEPSSWYLRGIVMHAMWIKVGVLSVKRTDYLEEGNMCFRKSKYLVNSKIQEYDRVVTKYSVLAKTAFLEEQAGLENFISHGKNKLKETGKGKEESNNTDSMNTNSKKNVSNIDIQSEKFSSAFYKKLLHNYKLKYDYTGGGTMSGDLTRNCYFGYESPFKVIEKYIISPYLTESKNMGNVPTILVAALMCQGLLAEGKAPLAIPGSGFDLSVLGIQPRPNHRKDMSLVEHILTHRCVKLYERAFVATSLQTKKEKEQYPYFPANYKYFTNMYCSNRKTILERLKLFKDNCSSRHKTILSKKDVSGTLVMIKMGTMLCIQTKKATAGEDEDNDSKYKKLKKKLIEEGFLDFITPANVYNYIGPNDSRLNKNNSMSTSASIGSQETHQVSKNITEKDLQDLYMYELRNLQRQHVFDLHQTLLLEEEVKEIMKKAIDAEVKLGIPEQMIKAKDPWVLASEYLLKRASLVRKVVPTNFTLPVNLEEILRADDASSSRKSKEDDSTFASSRESNSLNPQEQSKVQSNKKNKSKKKEDEEKENESNLKIESAAQDWECQISLEELEHIDRRDKENFLSRLKDNPSFKYTVEYNIIFPFLRRQRIEYNKTIVLQNAAIVIQRIFRSWRAKMRVARMKSRIQTLEHQFKLMESGLRKTRSYRFGRYFAASKIQANYKSLRQRRAYRNIKLASAICQRNIRAWFLRRKMAERRRRLLLGPEVLVMFRGGTFISGRPVHLLVQRCGNNYKFAAKDQQTNETYEGYVYADQVESLLKSNPEVKHYKPDCVARFLMDNLGLVDAIPGASHELSVYNIRRVLIIHPEKGPQVPVHGIRQRNFGNILQDQYKVIQSFERIENKGKGRKQGLGLIDEAETLTSMKSFEETLFYQEKLKNEKRQKETESDV